MGTTSAVLENEEETSVNQPAARTLLNRYPTFITVDCLRGSMSETEEDVEEAGAETPDRPSFTGQMVFKGDFDEDEETDS